MKELIDIISKRDKLFMDSTIEIFIRIELSIDCVEEFLSYTEPMFAAGEFSWNDVFLEEGFVTILGTVSFDEDIVVETGEGIVNITEDNAEYFARVVRMVLPYELVTNGTREEIMNFLEQLQNTGMGDDYTEIIKSAPETEFNITELTEEQQESLSLYNKNKTVNN